MFCKECGNQNNEANFCRRCGADLGNPLTGIKHAALQKRILEKSLFNTSSKDPDEMTGNGIGKVIIGDGFFMVAVILSATHTSVSSLLWLFLLIPAFFFFGIGLAEVLHAKQIRRRSKEKELNDIQKAAELPPQGISFIDTVKKFTSGELRPIGSITERTTRDLKKN